MQARILVVDDEETIRELLDDTLSQEGYECLTAAGVNEAVARLDRESFDLVICDIKMPGRSGLELLQIIKEKYPDTATLMATAVAELTPAIESLKMGAHDYLVKPFNLSEIAVSVKMALHANQLERENREYQLHLEERVKEQTLAIREMFLGGIRALIEALEAKDEYTRGHSQRVVGLCQAVARTLALSDGQVEKISLAAQLHDIGKIGVKDAVLNKPASLTPEEHAHVLSHVLLGEKILRPILRDEDILAMVRYHHEHCDGTGFPDGLQGEQIPLGARILAVADAYDAMTSDRPYRPPLPPAEAAACLREARGRQFDPQIVDAFLETPPA
jgi:response regulator RpfG family c-di-GMP phosphodiesterase